MKRRLLFLLAVTLAFTGCAEQQVQSSSEVGQREMTDVIEETDPALFEYIVVDDKVRITGYTGDIADVVIPAEIEGMPVTEIGSYAFGANEILSSVEIPVGVDIGKWAFSECSSLCYVSLSGTKTIGEKAFYECSSLTQVRFGWGLESIGSNAFAYTKLPEVILPETVISIGEGAFTNVYGLSYVEIPQGCTVEGGAFKYTHWQESLALEQGEVIFGDVLHDVGYTEEYTVPDGVRVIGTSSFSECRDVRKVTIPDGVEEIRGLAFTRCKQLTEIELPDSIRSIGHSAFDRCIELTSINIPEGVTELGSRAFSDCTALSQISLPLTLTEIEYGCFMGCTALRRIELPESVSVVDKTAFKDCSPELVVVYKGKEWSPVPDENGIYNLPIEFSEQFQ